MSETVNEKVKLCPLMKDYCVMDDCAMYHDYECAVISISKSLFGIFLGFSDKLIDENMEGNNADG